MLLPELLCSKGSWDIRNTKFEKNRAKWTKGRRLWMHNKFPDVLKNTREKENRRSSRDMRVNGRPRFYIVFAGNADHITTISGWSVKEKMIGISIRPAIKYIFMTINEKLDEQATLRASCQRKVRYNSSIRMSWACSLINSKFLRMQKSPT